MWRNQVSLVVLLSCLCLIVQTSSELYPLPGVAKYCGPVLADVLAAVCKGVYNMQINKKSVDESDSDEDYEYVQVQPLTAYIEDSRLPFPYRSRPNAASFLSGSFRRYSRGITDECCKKPCSLSELRSYCGPA